LKGDWDEDKKDFEAAKQLLMLLPALRAFELLDCACSDGSRTLFDNPMPHLRYVSFFNEGTSSSIHEVTRAISIPRIKGLFLDLGGDWRVDEIEWTHQGTALGALDSISSLKDLAVDCFLDYVVRDSHLLKVPLALEKLTCIFIYSGRLTPKTTIDALKPLYSTLVFLEIHYKDFMADLHGPAADFSSFISLKTLIVDDTVCFEKWWSDRPYEGSELYNRLPFTLAVLQVSVMDLFPLLGYELCS
jgi:hypothetical protein